MAAEQQLGGYLLFTREFLSKPIDREPSSRDPRQLPKRILSLWKALSPAERCGWPKF